MTTRAELRSGGLFASMRLSVYSDLCIAGAPADMSAMRLLLIVGLLFIAAMVAYVALRPGA
jgi:hypothetical protein